MKKITSPEARFWRHVVKSEGCWEWTAAFHEAGYGVINMCGKTNRVERAHRLSWMIHHGPIPAGLFVCHVCDNRKCVRPDHLFLGTSKDNLQDMGRKGRQFLQANPERRRRGTGHFNAKVTEALVGCIREKRTNGATLVQLGKEFGLHFSTIHDIVTHKTWTHI